MMRAEEDFPKIGLVVVGGIGRAIRDDLKGCLPPFSRTIAINTDAGSLLRVKADRKVLVGDGKTLPRQPLAAQLLAQTTIPQIKEVVAGLDMASITVGMVGSRLPANACIGYSTVSSRPDDQHDFRVSIFASGIF